MTAPTVIIDPAGIRALLSGAQAVGVLRSAADAVQSEAVRISPRGFMGYKAGLTVGPPTVTDGVPAIPVGSSSSGWHLVEFGSANNHPYRVMERSARAVGLDYRVV